MDGPSEVDSGKVTGDGIADGNVDGLYAGAIEGPCGSLIGPMGGTLVGDLFGIVGPCDGLIRKLEAGHNDCMYGCIGD